MKKLFLFFSLIVMSLLIKAQTFPNSHPYSSATTIEKPAGGMQAGIGMIETNYTDSTSANLNAYLKNYPGAKFFSTSENCIYVRNSTATGWIKQAKYSDLTFGTVTSVGGLSPLFTVSNPTTTPTFAQISQSQNLVYASPNGSSGNPSFRSLVAADLPTITGFWKDNGNTLTGSEYLGSNNGFDLVIKTNGTERSRWNTNGALAVGSGTDYGTSGYALLSQGSSTPNIWGRPTTPINNILAATGSNSVNHGANQQIWSWNTLGANFGLVLNSGSTVASGNSQAILLVQSSGANSNSNQKTFSQRITNVHTGTSSSNIGLGINVSGGTNNYALDIAEGKLRVQSLSAYNNTDDSMVVFSKSDSTFGYRAIPTGGGVSGTGTTDYLSVWNGSTSINARNFYLGGGNELHSTNDMNLIADSKIIQLGESADNFIKIQPSGLNQWHAQPNNLMLDTQGDVFIGDYGSGYSDNTGLGIRGTSDVFLNSYSGIALLGDRDNVVNGNKLYVKDADNIAVYDNTAHTGKFGINTNAPAEALDIVGNVQSFGSSAIFNTGGGEFQAGDLSGTPADNGTQFHVKSGDNISYFINTKEGFENTIKVGINTAIPTVALDVVGSGKIVGESFFVEANSNGAALKSTNAVSLGDLDHSSYINIVGVDDANAIYYNSASVHDFQTGTVQMEAYGAGAATFDGSGNITSVSDRRAKHSINPFRYGLSDVMKLKTSSFIYNQDKSNTVMSGFIAQDVQKAIPIAVHEPNVKGGMLSLETNAILAAAINSIQELKELNDKQQKEIDALKKQVKKLKK